MKSRRLHRLILSFSVSQINDYRLHAEHLIFQKRKLLCILSLFFMSVVFAITVAIPLAVVIAAIVNIDVVHHQIDVLQVLFMVQTVH